MATNKWILLTLVAFSTQCFSAYRVFELKVTPYDKKGRPGKAKRVLSTLDPNQYSAYYSGQGRVQMQDSYYCPGDTHRRALCAKPKKK